LVQRFSSQLVLFSYYWMRFNLDWDSGISMRLVGRKVFIERVGICCRGVGVARPLLICKLRHSVKNRYCWSAIGWGIGRRFFRLGRTWASIGSAEITIAAYGV
jgi:hypothetical protein